MAHDPLSPSEALRTRFGLVLVGLAAFGLVYSVVIVAQVLVGLLFVGFVAGLYVLYRVIAVLDSFADAAQRLVAVRERESMSEPGSVTERESMNERGSSD